MRVRAEIEHLPLQEIAQDEVRKALLVGETLAVLPNVTNIGASVRRFPSVHTGIFLALYVLHLGHNLVRNRRKTTPEFTLSCSFDISDIYARDYRDQERLLLHDTNDPKYVIDNSEHLNLLFESERLHMDGTFSTSPLIKTLGSASSLRFGVDSLILGVPVVYAQLPNRQAITYIHLFEVLSTEAKRLKKSFESTLIMTDLESGLAKAIALEICSRFAILRPTGEVFTSCFSLLAKRLKKDVFFILHSVYRKVQSLSLSTLYLEDLRIRGVIRRMMSLALIPRLFVGALFVDLEQDLNADERAELANLFKYFNDYWMHTKLHSGMSTKSLTRPIIIMKLGYNNRFKRRLHKSHPNVWAFIDSIQNEIDTIHSLVVQIASGMQPQTKRSKSRIVQQRVKELYDRFDNGKISIHDLLHRLSFFVAHEQ
ncbi:unnamed protein product [Adineta ricciae]|uniref:MULE transposase domain-containing protein n=1 Tax=Adineta ricciae TaxID=249248 RepID=A0A815VN01_ADIRI|nr:unnamed protein product [Adineta ricciae]CAF1620293.1 unnamed protein product [Adineta ricciae]